MAKVLLKGTKTRTAEQIANEIEAVGGSISSESGNNSFGVSVDVMKPDLKARRGLALGCVAQRDHAGEGDRA